MARTKMNIDVKGLDKFFKKLDKMGGTALKKEVAEWLDAAGIEFLDEVQKQIVAMQVVDTRRLLNSFDKGNEENVWIIKNGGLTLEIGTNVNYAKYVNDGHWTTKKGVAQRFVPGVWKGDKFEYIPGAKTGMLLRRKWVEGRPYWDKALAIYERMFGRAIERKMQEWIRKL